MRNLIVLLLVFGLLIGCGERTGEPGEQAPQVAAKAPLIKVTPPEPLDVPEPVTLKSDTDWQGKAHNKEIEVISLINILNPVAAYITEGQASVRLAATSQQDVEGNRYLSLRVPAPDIDLAEGMLAFSAWTSLPEATRAFYVRALDAEGEFVASWQSWRGVLGAAETHRFELQPGISMSGLGWEPGNVPAEGNPVRHGMPFHKYVAIRMLSALQESMLGLGLSEYHCGYQAYSVPAIAELPYAENSDELDFDTELTVQMKQKGLRVAEVPDPEDGTLYLELKVEALE